MASIPFVTVLMPVYNAQDFLHESLESILKQTFRDFEFLIIDDGSTDESPAILAEYTRRDSRVRVVRNEKNLGIIKSLNRGLDLARGELIARQDADDFSLPTRLEKQVAVFSQDPELLLLGTRLETIDKDSKVTGKMQLPLTHDEIKAQLIRGCCIGHGTVMFRSTNNRLRYDENAWHAEDYELWTRAVLLGKFANFPEYLYRLRMHSASISQKKAKEQQEISRISAKAYIGTLARAGRFDMLLHASLMKCKDDTLAELKRLLLTHPITAIGRAERKKYAGILRESNLGLRQLCNNAAFYMHYVGIWWTATCLIKSFCKTVLRRCISRGAKR